MEVNLLFSVHPRNEIRQGAILFENMADIFLKFNIKKTEYFSFKWGKFLNIYVFLRHNMPYREIK